MSDRPPLSEVWRAHVATNRPVPADLEATLEALWRTGVEAWPGVTLSAPALVEHLCRHLPETPDTARFLATVAARDLYLACACSTGDPAALAAFDRAILVQVPDFVRRVDPSPAFADEVAQLLRERLLLAKDGGAPRIAEYGGQGALHAFVRVAALRTALNLRRNRDDRSMDDVDEVVLADGSDNPEIGYLRSRYRAEFREALRTAFGSLPLEQRNVVRMHFGGGLATEQIGVLLQINRSTVGRWLSSARTALLHETRRLLRDQMRLSPADLDSLIAAVSSQLDMSLTSLLREPAP